MADVPSPCSSALEGWDHAYADEHGCFESEPVDLALVELRPMSSIPGAGRGLYAARDLPGGAPLTRYDGLYIPSTHLKGDDDESWDYAFEISRKLHLLGSCSPMRGHGMAQFANDAVHTEVNDGRDNNCDFEVVKLRPQEHPAVFLVSRIPIRRGEELLVSYHITYWTHRRVRSHWPESFKHWLFCQKRMESIIRRRFPGCLLESYIGGAEEEPSTDPCVTEEVTECRRGAFDYTVLTRETPGKPFCRCAHKGNERPCKTPLAFVEDVSEVCKARGVDENPLDTLDGPDRSHASAASSADKGLGSRRFVRARKAHRIRVVLRYDPGTSCTEATRWLCGRCMSDLDASSL